MSEPHLKRPEILLVERWKKKNYNKTLSLKLRSASVSCQTIIADSDYLVYNKMRRRNLHSTFLKKNSSAKKSSDQMLLLSCWTRGL